MKTKNTLLLLPLSAAGVATAFRAPPPLVGPPVKRAASRRYVSAAGVVNEEDSATSGAATAGDHDDESYHTSSAYATSPLAGMEEDLSVPQQEHQQDQQQQQQHLAMSQALPFMPVSDVLRDSTLAGNAGFDPLHLAQSKEQLMWFREAEVKHARNHINCSLD